MPRDDDKHRLQWIRYQELTQFRLFRLLRRRRAQRNRPSDQPPPDQPNGR